MSKKVFVKNIGSLSSAIMISRVLGLIRDQFMAYFLGTSVVADAFNVAYYIPNLMRRLFGEGALSAAFIPIYQAIGVEHGKKYQIKFALNILSLLFLFLTILSILGIFFTPLIVKIIAPGFNSYEIFLTIKYTRILFPFLFFIGISSTIISILNSHNYYFLPGLSSSFLNIAMILSLIISIFFTENVENYAYFLCFGTVLGGFLQIVVNLPLLKKVGYHLEFIFDFKSNALHELWTKFIPGVWGIAVRQINLVADKVIASFLIVGSITALQYGNRLMQLPLGIFAVAIGTATIPHFSKAVAEEKWEQLSEKLSFAILSLIIILLPVTILIYFFGKDYIYILFLRGAFDNKALIMTFNALFCYSLGLVFYGLNRALIAVFYAHKDTKTPVIISFVIIVVNIALNLILMKFMGYKGLALATSISAFIQFFIMSLIIKKRYELIKLKSMKNDIMKIIFSSVITIFAVYLINMFYSNSSFLSALLRSIFGSFTGLLVFFICCFLLKVNGSEIIKNKFIKNGKTK